MSQDTEKYLAKGLSKKDLIRLLEISSNVSQCQNETDFKKAVLSASELFSFESSSATIGPLFNLENKNTILSLIEISFPEGYFKNYFQKNFHYHDKCVRNFLETFEIQNFKEVNKKFDDSIVYNDGCEWGMPDGFAYGIADSNFSMISYFSFAGKYIENHQRTKAIIKYLVVHFTEALKKVVGHEKLKSLSQRNDLTEREIEVLYWLKEGKSSWEISVILGISERTTNFHIENIKIKLNAGNRTHAVAIALSEDIISL